ncbi:MAG: potassium channel family protein [Lysobacterales bacterium]
MLLEKIAIAMSVMFVCTLIHALFMMSANKVLESRLARIGSARRPFLRAVLIWQMILWMFLGICIEAVVWAAVYLANPEITVLPDKQTAFYFSMVTYTSLGYGDIVLTGNWRALSAIQAANGLIIFGWTTALIFYFIQKIQGGVKPA